jgi:hypothetical protein
MQVLTTLDFAGVGKINNLPDGVNAQDPATVAQLRASIEGLAWKDNVRVRAASNINLSAPGATIDGITMATGERFLAGAQTTGSEVGIYTWSGAALPATRSADANSAAELTNATVAVDEGTSAGTAWRQTAVNIVLGTTTIAFVAFGTVAPPASESTSGTAEVATQAEADAGTDDQRFITAAKLANLATRVRRFTQTIGDGTATAFTLTHNLGTRDIRAEVRRTSGNFDVVWVDIEFPTVNTARVVFASAPAAGAFQAFLLA